jgi:hypothetical protein
MSLRFDGDPDPEPMPEEPSPPGVREILSALRQDVEDFKPKINRLLALIEEIALGLGVRI